MWVRPALTTSCQASAFAPSAPASLSSAGSSLPVVSATAARWTAEGKTSFDDWPMFTWSFACAPSPARFARTSLAFMFEDVPDPVWNAAIRSATAASSRPSSPLTRAAAALIWPSILTTAVGTHSPETGKLSTALLVSGPHSCCSTAIVLLRSASVRALQAIGARHDGDCARARNANRCIRACEEARSPISCSHRECRGTGGLVARGNGPLLARGGALARLDAHRLRPTDRRRAGREEALLQPLWRAGGRSARKRAAAPLRAACLRRLRHGCPAAL